MSFLAAVRLSRPDPDKEGKMRKILFLGFVFCLVMISSCRLDHYKVYSSNSNKETINEVRLEDQFGSKEAKASVIEFFANPVKKNGEDIIDEKTHLNWYRIEESGPHLDMTVEFSNQFGDDQVWTIGEPVYLLVPTEKDHKGSPDETKHFKCYEVLSAPPFNTQVTLEDQFGRQVATVDKGMYFCTPVKKNDEGNVDLKGKHLACYRISQKDVNRLVNTINQFGDYDVNVEKSVMLCVPSDKK